MQKGAGDGDGDAGNVEDDAGDAERDAGDTEGDAADANDGRRRNQTQCGVERRGAVSWGTPPSRRPTRECRLGQGVSRPEAGPTARRHTDVFLDNHPTVRA